WGKCFKPQFLKRRLRSCCVNPRFSGILHIMPSDTPSSTPPLDPAQRRLADTERKRRKLRIARGRATGLLLASAVVYVLATHYGHMHGSLAWVAAFAEAAMV